MVSKYSTRNNKVAPQVDIDDVNSMLHLLPYIQLVSHSHSKRQFNTKFSFRWSVLYVVCCDEYSYDSLLLCSMCTAVGRLRQITADSRVQAQPSRRVVTNAVTTCGEWKQKPRPCVVWIDRPVHSWARSTLQNTTPLFLVRQDREAKRQAWRERWQWCCSAPLCSFVRTTNTLGGVDFAGRIIKYYNCARHSCRWIDQSSSTCGVVHPQCVRDRVFLPRLSQWHEQSSTAVTPGIARGTGGRIDWWVSCWPKACRSTIWCVQQRGALPKH